MKLPGLVACALSVALLFGCGGNAAAAASSPNHQEGGQSPLDIVNQRMSAYNNHDLPAFLATYADDVAIFSYPDKALGKSRKHMRDLFEPGTTQVVIHHQIAKDSFVVNHETGTDGDHVTEYVSIHEVRNGLIRSVRFVRD